MALPANKQNENIENVMNELKVLVGGIMNQVSLNTKQTNDHLNAIKVSAKQSQQFLGDLVAKAELDFEQMADAEAEALIQDAPDAESAGLGNDAEIITLLTEIRDATRETADQTEVLADAEREDSEDVLEDVPDTGGGATGEGQTGRPESKSDKEGSSLIAKVLGGLLGLFSGLFVGWLKALKMVFFRGFIAKIGNFFINFFKNLKTTFSGGKLAAGFARIGQFFKSIGSFFGRMFKIVKPIFQFFKSIIGIAGRVMGLVSRIFAPLLVIFSIFKSIQGFFEGFANTEGNFLQKLMGGIAGALTGFLDFLIAAPVNLIFDLIGWIAGIFGCEGVKEKLQSIDFSFGGIIKAMFDVINFMHGIMFKILKFPVALSAGIAGGIAALVNPSKSPKEGFMDAFNAVMNFGSGKGKPPVPAGGAPTTDGEKLTPTDNEVASAEKKADTIVGDDTSGEIGEEKSIYPVKISGFSKFKDAGVGVKHDEYTITGVNKKGQYTVTDPKGASLVINDPEVAAFTTAALENQAQESGPSSALVEAKAMMNDIGAIKGTGLSATSEALQAQRDSYRGGFMSGPVLNTSTNAPTNISSPSVTYNNSGSSNDNSLQNRVNESSGAGPN